MDDLRDFKLPWNLFGTSKNHINQEVGNILNKIFMVKKSVKRFLVLNAIASKVLATGIVV